MNDYKIIAITQARIGSSRLPGKILKKVNDETLLGLHVKRILKSKMINKLIVATTNEIGVEDIINICNKHRVEFFQGSLDDVLDRFYMALHGKKVDYVVRLTSDCPLIDPDLIDLVIKRMISSDVDYCSNTLNATFPDGCDVEVFKYSALEKAWKNAKLVSEREHVTSYIWENSTFKGQNLFKSISFEGENDYSWCRLTIDHEEDFLLIKKLIERIGSDCHWKEYADFISNDSALQNINTKYIRNEGYLKSKKADHLA